MFLLLTFRLGVDGVKSRAVDFQIMKFKEEAKKMKEEQESNVREQEIMQRMMQIQVCGDAFLLWSFKEIWII